MSDIGVNSEEELRQLVAKIRIKLVDLSKKRSHDVLAQAADPLLCSPTGNCEVWILRQKAGKYVAILNREAVNTFTIQPTITNGLHDIVLGQHGSATEQGLTLFRFNGIRYRVVSCYQANWSVLEKNGEIRDVKEPQNLGRQLSIDKHRQPFS